MKINNATTVPRQIYRAGLALILLTGIVFGGPGCKKAADLYPVEGSADSENRPPRPPVYFYFDNCTHPTINGNFVAGVATAATVTLHYINSPGGSYPAYTSSTVNGIRLTAPAGTLSSNGNIVFTASGTPVTPGITHIPVSIKGSIPCDLGIAVLNAPPPPGNCSNPGAAIGSKGCITFTYRGQQVTYTTVRAADGKIWIQQNLGSPQVALNGNDQASFGHYFQWGRWDDGHQVPTSLTVTGSALLRNPSHIPAGNPKFIIGTSTATSWWGIGGAATNTWSGTTASATNGKDPCTALGAGWHIANSAEWQNVLNLEIIFDNVSAFESNLKLTESGYRTNSNGALVPNWVGGYYWTSDASNGNIAKMVNFDASYPQLINILDRGYGINCRCVKN